MRRLTMYRVGFYMMVSIFLQVWTLLYRLKGCMIIIAGPRSLWCRAIMICWRSSFSIKISALEAPFLTSIARVFAVTLSYTLVS